MTDSQTLLVDYVRTESEAAFRELVTRYVNLVYSTALRLVEGDTHRAEDVAQTVFMDLARMARTLSSEVMLGGWLHRHTCFVAANTMRGERRRQSRERQAVEMNALQDNSGTDFSLVAPILDEAINELGEADRTAVLLRFFEQRDFRSVGEALGSNEDAARMRVTRALEKLEDLLKRRGVTTSAASLGVVLSANAVQAAPVGLAITISTAAAITGTTLATTATAIAVKTIAMTTLQKTLITATIAIIAGAGIYEARQASQLRGENESQQQQIAQLKLESKSLSNRLPVVADTKSPPDEHLNELLRLRGEVGVLRRQKTELENSLANVVNSQQRGPNPVTEQQPPSALPDDYPKTAEGATTNIFNTWARGDWDSFFTNFAEPGVPREVYDQMFNDPIKSNYLAGLEIVSLGQPTNSFGPNMWFVPYKIRFKDGSEKEFQLHVAQDPRTQRWYFKGGF
jgi:RNA polymerase sigma factor (sigma-70 family)